MERKIIGQIRKAIQDYDMIKDGDKIAIGVSGGKDSLSLLYALSKLQKYYPKKFEIIAITLTLGIGNFDLSWVKDFTKSIDVKYHIEETLIGKILFEERNESNPCSLCANLRRGALNNLANKLGCNKVALAHNKNDVIETLLLSTFYEGRLYSFSPVTYLSKMNLNVIRPLIYVEEEDIKNYIKLSNIIPVKNPCLANGKTKRQQVKELISSIENETKDIKSNIFGAIKRSQIPGWKTD